MSPELLLPVVTTAACVMLAGASLASFRLGWGKLIKMGLAWIAIFAGIYAVTAWFMLVRGTASSLL